MIGIDSFNPVMMPGVALLILSTTMRMGNVRMSLFDLSKVFPDPADCQSSLIFERRMQLLGWALQLLYLSLLTLLAGAMADFGSAHGLAGLSKLQLATLPIAFTVLAGAIAMLCLESRLAIRSALLASRELRGQASQRHSGNA